MAKPKLALIPAAQGDKFYSVLPSDGVGDFDFTRNSSATRIAPTGFIQEVGAFGSELVTNGNFDNNSDWSLGSGWSISGGNAVGVTASGNLQQNIGVIASKQYKLTFNVTAYTSGSLSVDLGGSSAQTTSGVGLKTFNFTTTSTGNLRFYGGSFSGSIDNVSVIEIIGNKSRLNYDLLNGKVVNCPHYLLEPARTNLFSYSEDFNSGSPNWVLYGGATVTSNNAISPDGTLNADKLSNQGGIYSQRVYNPNIDYVFSLFIKKNTATGLHMNFVDQASGYLGGTIIYTYSSGAIQITQSANSSVSAKSVDYGNGWIRLIMKFTTNVAQNYNYQAIESIGGDSLIWGAMLEQGSYPTSYIPTNGTTITRAAETANGSGDAATFNSTEGVLMAEISALANDITTRKISLSDGSSSNALYIGYITTSNSVRGYISSAGSSAVKDIVIDITTFNKISIKYQNNGTGAFWVNGFNMGSINSGASFNASLSSLQFQREQLGTPESFYGNTREVQYFDSALTDAQLETLTSWTSLQEMITSQLYTNY